MTFQISASPLFFIIIIISLSHAIIVSDDDYQKPSFVSQYDNTYDKDYDEDYYEDAYGKRRHKKRRKPCPTNKVAPNGKTFVNIYYSNVDVAEATHNYHSGGGGGGGIFQDSAADCGPGIMGPVLSPGNNHNFNRPNRPNRPGLIHHLQNIQQNRPGIFQFLNNVLFGDSNSDNNSNKPYDNSLSSPSVVEPEDDTSYTGPLGGTVPDKIRVAGYMINLRRAHKEFNRELDSFFRPFYRLF